MTRRALRPTALLLLAFAALAAAPAAAEDSAAKRLIDAKDLLQFHWLADPRISPDGERVAFVRVGVDSEGAGYETSLWWVPSDGSKPPQALTRGTKDGQPRWSPDGSRLAFVRAPAKGAKDSSPQIWILDLAGGEPWQLTDQARGAGSPAWSPDGQTLAFVSEATDEDVAQKAKPPEKPVKETDVTVTTRAIYRFNGGGTLDYARPDHLWTVALPAPGAKPAAAKRVTSGPFADGSPTWSRDGKSLYFTATRSLEGYYDTNQDEAWSVPASGGEPVRLVSIGGNVGSLTLSPDGTRAAFVGAPGKPVLSCTQQDLWVAGLDGGPGAARNLTATLDAEVGEGISSDQHPPRGGGSDDPLWTPDGKSLILKVGRQGRSNLERFDVASGAATPLTHGDQEAISYTMARDGRLAATFSTGTRPAELYLVSATGEQKRIASLDEELFAGFDLAEPEEVRYPSFDGKQIQAWLLRPPHSAPGTKLPLILYIHGGPHSAYGWTFFHEFQYLAAKGYAVLYPNPRGSTSYGQSFCNSIQYKYPGDDAKDLLAGVDALVARGVADPARLGVTGGSGGGVLTNWIVTQTDRFKAAVSQRSIADWSDFWYTADFWLNQPMWFRGAPFEAAQKADFAARSPITFVERIKTPLMLIEGNADLRTPPAAGGEQMFRALKYLHRPTAMVRFPDESHELSRSGQPWHRIERMRHIAAWFDKYVLGEKVPGYEVGEEGQAAAGKRE